MEVWRVWKISPLFRGFRTISYSSFWQSINFFRKQTKWGIFALSCPFQQALETWSRLMIIRLMFLRLWALTICNYAQHANDADSKNKLWLIAKDRDICNILFTSFGSTQRSCLRLQSDISASHNDTWHCAAQ